MKGNDFENFFNNMHYYSIDYINRSVHEWNNISIDFLSPWLINKSLPILLSKISFGALLISMFFYWFQAMFQSNNLEVHFNGGYHKLVIGKVPSLAMWLANITLALMLSIRWIESGHFPLSNLYESLLFLSWGLTSIHLFLENALNKENQIGPSTDLFRRKKSGMSMQSTLTLGAITSPLSLFTNAFATFSLPHEMQKVTVLVPALQSNWLIMHVSVMIISYAALLSGSLLAMALLVIQFSLRTDNKKSHINSAISTKTSDRAVRITPVHTLQVSTVKNKDERCNEPTPYFVDQNSTLSPLPPSVVQVLPKDSVNLTSLSTPSLSVPPYASIPRTTCEAEESGLRSKVKPLAELQGVLLSKEQLKGTSSSTLDSSCSFIELVSLHVRSTAKLESFLESIASQLFKVRKSIDVINGSVTDCSHENTKRKDPPVYLSSGFLGAASQEKNLLETLDNLSYRSIGLGFALLTIGILSGAVWANEAWGSYWSWDPKETWAFVTWLVFALYLHTRLSKGWIGKESAFVATFGFVVVWFCYLGVNIFGKGLHSYGWMR